MNLEEIKKQIEEAIQYKEYVEAINLADQYKLNETYVNLLEKYCGIFEAAEAAEEKGLWKKAIELYNKIGNENEAGMIIDTVFFDKK